MPNWIVTFVYSNIIEMSERTRIFNPVHCVRVDNIHLNVIGEI